MHTLISVLLALGLCGGLIFEFFRVMRELAAPTSRHLPAQRDFAPRDYDADERL